MCYRNGCSLMVKRIEHWPYAARAVSFALLAMALTGLLVRSEVFKRVDAGL